MKLEKFSVGNKKKKITIVNSLVLIIILLLIGIIIYQSYALYEDKKTFNVIDGTVPVFGSTTGTIELAYTVNGATSTQSFPSRTAGYGAKSVTCENGVKAEWNDIVWSLEVKDPNNNKQIKCTIDFIKTKIYGIERTLTSSNSAWTRTNDAQGLVANAQFGSTVVQNDFDNIYPWSEIKSYNYNTSTNKITAWYGESGFKFDGSNGEVLTYIPEFYYKRYQDTAKEYISITKKELEGYKKSEAFSVGRYTISGNASGVHSKSGSLPFVNATITDFRNYAKNLSGGFGQMDYHYFIIQLLYLVEYASYDSQAKLGLGNVDNSGPVQSGGCNTLGMHSGTLNNDGKHSIIYRGMEDIYGNVWQFIDGINMKDYQVYVCYDQSKYEVDKYDGCYQKLGYSKINNTSGFITKLGYDTSNPLISLATSIGGTYNTYIGDAYYSINSDNGTGLFASSGCWSPITQKEEYGLFLFFENTYSSSFINTSSRLIKINN